MGRLGTGVDKYSVLMSLYIKEKPHYLRQSLDSMLMQTVPPDEIVLVKDGQLTWELEQVLDEYKERYPDLFKIVNSETNVGLGMALNIGLQHCSNELVARMDTDDISLPHRCQKQLELFALDETLDIVGTMVDEFCGSPSNVVSSRVVPISHEDIYEFAKRRSAFNHPTVMFKKSKVLECGGYSELRRNQDVDLFGRMLYAGCKAANIDEALVLFRVSDDLSRRRRSWQNTYSYIVTIYRQWRRGYSGISDFLAVFLGQLVMFVAPLSLQRYLYRRFLRRQDVKKLYAGR